MPDEGARFEARFEPRSVAGPGSRRAWLPPAVVLAALAGLLAVGLLDRQPAGPAAPNGAVVPASSAGPVAVGSDAPERTRRPRSERFSGEALTGPAVDSPSLARADVRTVGRYLFVHGEVFSDRVAVVIVSLRDADGRTRDIRTVTVPGGSTAFRIGAVDRFDVQFPQPDRDDGSSLTVQVSCYDRSGAHLGAVAFAATAAAG